MYLEELVESNVKKKIVSKRISSVSSEIKFSKEFFNTFCNYKYWAYAIKESIEKLYGNEFKINEIKRNYLGSFDTSILGEDKNNIGFEVSVKIFPKEKKILTSIVYPLGSKVLDPPGREIIKNFLKRVY